MDDRFKIQDSSAVAQSNEFFAKRSGRTERKMSEVQSFKNMKSRW